MNKQFVWENHPDFVSQNNSDFDMQFIEENNSTLKKQFVQEKYEFRWRNNLSWGGL